MRKSIWLLVWALWLTCSSCLAAEVPAASWTVYVYLCGSDLESQHGAATSDLTEILAAPLPENVQVLIQTGGSHTWHNNVVQPGSLQRYLHTGAANNMALVDEQPQSSMSESETLASFLAYGKEHYPSEHQAFIFWDHGGGSVAGAIADETTPGQLMSLQAMEKAFESVYPEQEKPFALIGFDACLMSTIDVANTFAPYAQYLVASQELEPGNGWFYTPWLTALGQNTSIDPAELGKQICDTYYEGCRQAGTEGPATLALTDLSKLSALQEAYQQLGDEALNKASEDVESFIPSFARSALQAENYGGNTANTGYTNMVDLGDFAKQTAELLPESTPDFMAALQEAVIYQVKGPYRQHAHGLSGFHLYGIDAANLEGYLNLSSVPAPYKEIYAYMAQGAVPENVAAPAAQLEGSRRISTLKTHPLEDVKVSVSKDGSAVLQLNPQQAQMLGSIKFMLMNVDPQEDTLLVLGSDNDLEADWEKGLFKDNFQGRWLALDGHLLYREVLDENEAYTLYSSPIKLNGKEVALLSAYNYQQKQFKLLGTRENVKSFGVAAKTLTPFKAGDTVETLFYGARLSQPELLVQVGGETFTVGPKSKVTEKLLEEEITPGKAEHFAFVYDMTDLQNNSASSQVVFFTIKDGEISLTAAAE